MLNVCTATVAEEVKKCAACGIEKALYEFKRCNRGNKGVQRKCKACCMSDEKKCSSCDKIKPLDAFFKSKGGRYGVEATCKQCNAIRLQDWQGRNRDKCRSYQQKYVSKNKLKAREMTENWRKKNKAHTSEYSRTYRLDNLEEVKERYKEWAKNNKARVAAHNAARNACKIQRTVGWGNKEKIREIYNAAAAFKFFNPFGRHCVDHIIPLRGKCVSGLHVEENLQVMTGVENNQKYNKFEDCDVR